MAAASPRRYSEDEMRTVFAQAARAPAPAPAAEGLTLDELQRIGASAGLDPDRVAAAVASLDRPVDEGTVRWGMRDTVRQRRVLSAAFSDSEWEEAVAYLRATYGGPGTSGQTGRTREWTSPGPYAGGSRRHGQVHVTVRPLGDGAMTEVTLDYPSAKQGRDLATVLGGMFAMFGVLGTVLVGLLKGAWGDMLLLGAGQAAVAALMFAFVRAAVVRQQRTVAATFDASLDRLDLLARSDASPAAAPLLTLDVATDAAAEAPAAARRQAV